MAAVRPQELLQAESEFVLLESLLSDRRPLLFRGATQVITAWTGAEVLPSFQQAQHAVEQGFWVAGYVCYEAGWACVGLPDALGKGERPLLALGVFEDAEDVEVRQDDLPIAIANARFQVAPETWQNRLADIREDIARGDTYQVNYSGELHFDATGDGAGLYRRLTRRQPVDYAALLRLGKRTVVSVSPELFFRVETTDGERRIVTRPMKGTAPRGCSPEADERLAGELAASEKDRAENIMIVDLLRNDLGRVCQIGSVEATQLLEVEHYPSVHQMVSQVEGTLRADIGMKEVFRSLFPCGSITGAPKRRTMQIIQQLEGRQRGVYTGAIGYWGPDDQACWSVAIRTVELDECAGGASRGKVGLGSGITWLSTPHGEYRETLSKGAFLTKLAPPAGQEQDCEQGFGLVETMRWDGASIPLWRWHWERLSASAMCFGIEADREYIEELFRRQLHGHPAAKVRLVVRLEGMVSLEVSDVPERSTSGVQAVLASQPISRQEQMLYHKTTCRTHYAAAKRDAENGGAADAVLWNEGGFLTETIIGCIVGVDESGWRTPPVTDGLLPGVYRTWLLHMHPRLRVGSIHRDELPRLRALYRCNAVRGVERLEIKTRR